MRPTTRMVVLGGRKLWTPAALGSLLALWLDVDDSSTITLNGSTVSEWRDKSGNGRHVSQSTAANQPTYSATGMVGKPTLDWGAAINDRSLFRTGMTGYSPVRYFGVADYDGPDPYSNYCGLISHTYVGVSDLIITDNGGQNWFGGLSYFLNGGALSSVALPTISVPFVFATNFAQSANRPDIYIGSDRGFSFSGRGWLGKISEVIAVDILPSTADRQRLEGYLAHKWGLIANLPSDHPFKFTPPIA